MKLIRFTFANIFDFKLVMDKIKADNNSKAIASRFHSCNSDELIILFNYSKSPLFALNYVNSICTPTNIEDLHE